MSARERRPRKPPPNPILKPALVVLGLVVTFLVGISLGRALEDGPSPGGTQENVRTLQPQPLPSASRTLTVTVTTG